MNANLSAVPAPLKALPNWVSWKLVKKSDEDSKVPFIVGTDKHASSTNPATWVDFDTAVRNTTLSNTGGIGFVIGGKAVEEQIVGFDIDGCRNPDTGDVTPWAERVIDCLDSYTEFTPSGSGVRVWVKGALPGKERVFNLDPTAGFGGKVKIEVFDRARYFTVTGDAYFEETVDIESRDLTEAYELCREIKEKHPAKSEPLSSSGAGDAPTGDAGAKIQSAGLIVTDKYELLMHGTIASTKPFVIQDSAGNKLEFPSQSEADLALCTASALRGNNPELVWADYEASSLYRDKWGLRKEYFCEHTIAKAIQTAEKIKSEAKPSANELITANAIVSGTTANPAAAAAVTPFVTVDGDAFMAEDIPPRKVLLRTISQGEPVFFEQSINQIFAWRGVGKTCLGLGLVHAFATAGKFLNWEVPERARVLYVEGELPQSQFQERWKQIIGKTDGYARLLTLDKQDNHTIPSLATAVGMAKIEATLAQLAAEGFKVDVLFLDSISTLFNVKANDEETWITIQSWLISLRSRGICLFFFHHAGKSGMSRSHSKSEDMLDVSIKLDAPREKESGCLHAVLTYDKARAGLDEPTSEIKMRRLHSATCRCKATGGMVIGCRGDQVRWEYALAVDVKKAEAFRMFSEEASVRDIGRALKMSKSTVGNWRAEWSERKEQSKEAN